ncbi:MAG: hypothetical protein V4793_35940 [Paraburkholderia tropica]|uniref:Uncharacterized protein n=1 Tax=Paraburkholderia tropica TaxID=92647 RepID=A0ABX5MR45_9BURK|nr:hypothetical protein [Paraburkholderia tropica]MDE1141686.1 hypothetical protein [Paraburkholderia tropica]PXX16403.1 hypothetical protein C7400_108211 [Paraburkholderia tropica]PZW82795.1 hypothetical protein C7399_108211 [Paraburkholderia tropica]
MIVRLGVVIVQQAPFGLTIDVLVPIQVPIQVTVLVSLLTATFLAIIVSRRRELAADAPRV